MRTRTALLALACGGVLAAPAVATDVYSNTATPLNTFHVLLPQGAADSPERGTTLTLAGSDRWITTASLRLRIGNSGAAGFTGRVRLYANDGPGGAPGTLLREGAPEASVIDSGADLTYIYNTGGVLVPGTVTLSYQITGRTGSQAPMGPAQYSPPTIGTPLAGLWERSAGGAWTQVGAGEPPWGVRLIACYPDCDGSNSPPGFNVGDFACFLQKFAAGLPYANCDGSTAAPVLNVMDFTCFLQRYAAGCP